MTGGMKGRTGVRSSGPVLGEFPLAFVDNKRGDAESLLCDVSRREPRGQVWELRLEKEVEILEYDAFDVLHDKNAAIVTVTLLRGENLLA